MDIRATRNQIEDFRESLLWKDMVRALVEWRRAADGEGDVIVQNAMDTNPSTASVLMHIGSIDGRKMAIDYMLALPGALLEMLEIQKEEENGTD